MTDKRKSNYETKIKQAHDKTQHHKQITHQNSYTERSLHNKVQPQEQWDINTHNQSTV